MTVSIQFLDHGNHFCLHTHDDAITRDHLPAEIYMLRYNPDSGAITFERRAKTFRLPERRFGKHQARQDIIRAEYDRMNPTMGILLDGLKGSGKSMFAEDMGNWMVGQGLPVLMINQPLPSDVIRRALTLVGPCMLYFDEFGKTYNNADDRYKLLPLFSDTNLTGVMFVVTGNDKSEFSEYLFDRPQRFRYRLSFRDLEGDAVMEVADHYMLNDPMREVLTLYTRYLSISYDMLNTVASMIRGCQTFSQAREALEIMNVPKVPYPKVYIHRVLRGNVRQAVDEAACRLDSDTYMLTLALLSGEALDIEELVTCEIPHSLAHLASKAPQTLTVGDLTVHYGLTASMQPNEVETTSGNSASALRSERAKVKAGAAPAASEDVAGGEGPLDWMARQPGRGDGLSNLAAYMSTLPSTGTLPEARLG